MGWHQMTRVSFRRCDVGMEAAHVLIFHSLTPHQSGTNTANYPRRSLYLTYNARRAGDLKADYYNAYKTRTAQDDKFFR